LDKSVSVNGQDARLEARVEYALTPILYSKISNTNDYVEVHLIHGESIGAKALLQKTWEETPPCEATMGPDTYRQEEQDYNNRLKKFRNEIKSELLGQLNQQVIGAVVNETDMLGTLEVISDFINNSKPGEKNTVVFFSDMVHSKDEPRDYHEKPIIDLTEAEMCAKKDFEWLKTNHKVDPKAFDNLDLKIRFTAGEYDKTQNESMRYYWNALFREVNPLTRVDIQ
jgi:hypothetical protein